jgi:phage replication O-like protein O
MANPQKENGHTSIANEIIEALVKTRIGGTEWSIIMYVIRMTYGFHKKEDWISYTRFQKATEKSRPTVWKAIEQLVTKKILVTKKQLGKTFYSLNKDYSQWVVTKTKLVTKKKRTSYEKATQVVTKKQPTKESITKENIQKKIIDKSIIKNDEKIEYGKTEINQMLKALKNHIGIDDFADAQRWQRIYAKHCYGLIVKIGVREFEKRLDHLLEDPFTAKNCNKIKFIYNNIKGYIEPKQDSSQSGKIII